MFRRKIMKKLIIAIAVIMALVLLAGITGPQIILFAAKQEPVAESYAYSEYFFNEYDQVRKHFALRAEELAAQIYSHPIDEGDGLYIDCMYLPAEAEKTNLIVLTTGVHGIEGYIGSVMLDVFFQEIAPTLENDTGILVISNVNPYGMKYHRRYNENNVDLNRNFIIDWDSFDLSTNKDYPKVDAFLGPEGQIGNALWHEAGFYLALAKEALTVGADTVSDALLGGQYEYPRGVYYGGTGDEDSTVFVKEVFTRCLESGYENIVHIDIHSGYGQRYNMVIFNSVYETMNEAETIAAFGYDNVISYDSEAFYVTTGDTTDFFYRLRDSMGSEKDLFSTCFEFGTIGDSFIDSIISLKYTVDENRQHWYPSDNELSAEVVRQHYLELFYPTEQEWREKTVADFSAATRGVLSAKLK